MLYTHTVREAAQEYTFQYRIVMLVQKKISGMQYAEVINESNGHNHPRSTISYVYARRVYCACINLLCKCSIARRPGRSVEEGKGIRRKKVRRMRGRDREGQARACSSSLPAAGKSKIPMITTYKLSDHTHWTTRR